MRSRLVPLLAALAALTSSPTLAHPQANVSGVVYDSIAMAPLSGAIVQLVQRDDPARSLTARADAQGAFAFESVPSGSYLAGFLHPKLDSLLLSPTSRRFDVPPNGTSALRLAIPSRRTILTTLCGARSARDSSGLLLGRVRAGRDGMPANRARLRVQWTEIVVERGLRTRFPSLTAEADEDGEFALCGVPSDSRLRVQAWTGTDTSGLIDLDMPASGVLVRDVHLGVAERVIVVEAKTPADSSEAGLVDSIAVLRGAGVLRGTVRRADPSGRGRPVAGVTVRVRDTDLEARTDAEGAFTLRSLPTGTRVVEAGAVGYQPVTATVDITERGGPPLDLALATTVSLDTMRVYAARDNAPWLKGYEARKKMGVGRYIDEATLEKRNPMNVADALRLVPNVVTRAGRYSSQQILMKAMDASGMYCSPNIFIDGVYVDEGGLSLDALVSAREIRAVEVYRSQRLAPSEFQPMKPCGIIVIWRGARESPRTNARD